jgi:NAD+ synthase (glutamine-hydrolysing)
MGRGWRSVKIGLAQYNPTIGAFGENVSRMVLAAEKAKQAGCGLVVFPELALCGYPPRDLLERQEFIDDTLQAMDRLISAVRGIGVLCGYASPNTARCGKPLHNTAVLFEDGAVLAKVHKRLLPSYDLFDETRYFEPGEKSSPVVFRGMSFGITICEDIWNDRTLFPLRPYSEDPVADLALHSPDVFINISASPFDIKKCAARHRIVEFLAAKYQRPFLYANMVGGQDRVIFDGNSFAVDAGGRVIARAADFSEDLIVIDIESRTGDMRETSEGQEEAVFKALQCGLRDYMARCGFKKVVLGLSGGIDSSVTAVIAAMTLGPENVLGVLMPSPYTSRESIEDAAALARNLGIETATLPIADCFEAYLRTLRWTFSGTRADVTEENLQARIRGNFLMAISNKFGHLVLSTGNKTELAIGYCTLYGDLSGGYALISDVPKTMVYRLASYINSRGSAIPERVITKEPSAELRPNQRDRDDLPPYELLDTVLELYLEGNASPDSIVARGFDQGVVQRIVRMVDRSEYKRQQAPLGPRVTTRAFGCDRRYPIAHGYRRVLQPSKRQSAAMPAGH